MDVGGLTTAVSEFWFFLWPPVLNLAMILVLFRYVAPQLAKRMISICNSHLEKLAQNLKSSEVVEEFGIKKLLPGAVAFVAIFVLYASSNLTLQAGNAIPGVVTYTPSALFTSRPHDERLVVILSKYQNIKTSDDLSSVIQNLNREFKATDQNMMGYAHWDEKVGTYSVVMSYLKFYFVFALVCIVSEIYWFKGASKLALRFLCVVGVIASSIIFVGYRLIDAYDQSASGAISVAKAQVLISSETELVIPADIDERMMALYKRYGDKRRWWNISF